MAQAEDRPVLADPPRGVITPDEQLDPTEVELPVDLWRNHPGITESQFFREFLVRLKAGRDMHTYITAEAETGVGKSMLALIICMLCDVHGFEVGKKATLSPREYSARYDHVPPGSWLLGDEWERAMDTRRAMAKDNVELSHDFASKRYRQVFSVLTLPSRTWLDKRVRDDAADYWIQALSTPDGEPKGEARVYRLKTNEHYETNYTTKTEIIEWPNIEKHSEYKRLNRLKKEELEGHDTEKWVHRDDVKKLKRNYWNKATKEARFHIIRSLYEFGMTQSDISDVFDNADELDGISQGHISTLVNANSFEDVYTS
jgi:hypothetical protein